MPKKYSLNVENDEVVSVEVDGVRYERPDQIPDPEDRAQIERLMSRPRGESPDDALDEEFGEEFDKQFEEDELEARRQAGRAARWLIAIFAGVSILMLAIAAFSGWNTTRGLGRQMSADGRVLELTLRRDNSGREFYYPVVEFRLPDGERAVEQVAEGSWPAPYQPGEAVTVFWDAAQPHNVHIRSSESAWTPWILTGITGVLGLAFGIAAIFAWSFTREERELAAQAPV